jgi:hypothetical protein
MEEKENCSIGRGRKVKIRCTKEVRALLVELDEHVHAFSDATRMLGPDGNLDQQQAVSVGAERESIRVRIVGCAWRINKVSKGEK